MKSMQSDVFLVVIKNVDYGGTLIIIGDYDAKKEVMGCSKFDVCVSIYLFYG